MTFVEAVEEEGKILFRQRLIASRSALTLSITKERVRSYLV